MKRILKFILCAALCINQLFAAGITVNASEKDFSVFYDFEDESIANGTGAFKHTEWLASTAYRKQFQTYFDEERQTNTLALYTSGRPVLTFGRLIDSGNLHISFDVKWVEEPGTTNGALLMPGAFTTRDGYGDDVKTFDDNTISKFARAYATEVTYPYTQSDGQEMLNTWGSEPVNKTFEANVWHRYDFVFQEYSTPETSVMYFYIDGECVNPNKPMQFGGMKSIKGIFWHCSEGTSGNPVLIDNVRVNNYDGAERLYTTLDKTSEIPLTNAELTVRFHGDADIDQITEGNIIINREWDSKRVNNISIIDRDEKSIKVRINERLSSEKYSIGFDNSVRDKILDLPTQPISFLTEISEDEEVIVEGGNYYENNLNDYTDLENPPENWYQVKTVRPFNIKSAPGASGDADDYSAMINGTNNSRRYVIPLNTALKVGDGISAEFDVKYSGTAWNFSVVEDKDMRFDVSVNAQTYDKNVIAGIDPSGKLGYATERTNLQDFTYFADSEGNNINIGENEWHKINLKVLPVSSEKTKISVSIDGGAEISVESNAGFITNPIAGIAFSTVNANKGAQELYIDNISVNALTIATRPIMYDLYSINYMDERKEITSSITTATKYIDIIFSVPVSDENINEKITLMCDGNMVDCEYEFLSDGKEIRVKPIGLFEADSVYTVTVSGDVSHMQSDVMTIGHDYIKTFKVLNDAGFNIFERGFKNNKDGSMTCYYVKMYKTDNAARNYTLAVASYKNETDAESGKVIKVLDKIKYLPIILGESDKDVYEFGNEMYIETDGADDIRGFLWSYPNAASVLSETK